MAYFTYVYPRRQTFIQKINSVRKHHHVTPINRRLLQIICGFFAGLFIAYVILKHRRSFNSTCRRTSSIGQFKENVNGFGDSNSEDIAENDVEDITHVKKDSEQRKSINRSLLFVGVMTAQKYLETRAAAVYDTWGKEIPGKIAFFSSGVSVKPINAPHLPLVPLKGVDDSYPPQKKSFLMLQYMWEHFGNKYEWFLRADDDVYIRADKIETFLRSINSSKPHFIGQAGRGNQEEFGLLSLEYDENFCMGGPGIILSRETLKKIAPHVKNCLQNLYTTHEDVELGRCVQRFARIPCTWSYEMQSIFYHNFSGSFAFTGNLKTKEVHRAITLHPIKQHKHMYRVHHYMQGLKIHDLQQRKISLYRDLRLMEELRRLHPEFSINKDVLPADNYYSNLFREANLFGMQPDLNKYHPRNEDDVFTWDLISRSIYSNMNLNPRRKIEAYLREGLDDVIREVMDNINLFSRERGRVIEFQQILYGYYRLNPLYGPDYILDVLLTFKKYRGKKMTVPVRRHAYLQQQFTGLEVREIFESTEVNAKNLTEEIITNSRKTYSTEIQLKNVYFDIAKSSSDNEVVKNEISRKLINMVLPLSGKLEAFSRFMKTYEEVCLKQNENVLLFIILFLKNNSDMVYDKTLKIINNLRSRYLVKRSIKIISLEEKFARAKALDYGMKQVNANDLLFFIDVDMVWTTDTLQRIRLNTVLGKMVYFPIVFSEFDPTIVYRSHISPNHFLINEENGYWRIFGFGIMSTYKADINKIGGFDTSITGWGKEDVDLFEKFVLSKNLSILRSADPSLIHIFHIVDCDSSLDLNRLNMCHNTRTETYGSVYQLANLIYSIKTNIFQFARSKIHQADLINR
ncbi:hypothetical protein PGB90_003873 [Kerria lacca]